MKKHLLVVGIIFLFIGMGFQPAFANDVSISIFDDITPPVTTHTLDPPEPDGNNGWYVSDVNVTLTATDDMSGVKEIKYRIYWGVTQTIDGDNGTFPITKEDDGNDLTVEYWAIDNAGNEETPHNEFTIDMDQTKPKIDIITELIEGNPFQGWLFRFTTTATDDTSGLERVEFYLNGELQDTIYGSGPEYQWEFRDWGDMAWEVISYAYDSAGNYDYEEAWWRSRDIVINQLIHPMFYRLLERFPVLQKLILKFGL